MNLSVTDLPHVNASLNACACCLLVTGWWLIRQGHETWHKRVMLACFASSVLFLTSYLVYHFHVPSKAFPRAAPVWLRSGYYAMLLSHVLLAATVPFLAVVTIYLGLRDRRSAHRRLARITFPIWLYVSLTGVLVYIALYWISPKFLTPAQPTEPTGSSARREMSQMHSLGSHYGSAGLKV